MTSFSDENAASLSKLSSCILTLPHADICHHDLHRSGDELPWVAQLGESFLLSGRLRRAVGFHDVPAQHLADSARVHRRARIDGCSDFDVYLRIVLPLASPAMGMMGLITFIGSWNYFIGPLIVMTDMQNFTLALALRAMQGTGHTPWGAMCAGTSIAVLPLLVLFVFTSRRLVSGLTAGAVKS